jgi:hypothetical protein
MRKTREYTCAVLDALDQGVLDPRAVVEMCLGYLCESEVRDMCHRNDLAELVEKIHD